MTFLEQFVDFQRIVGELTRLRNHNCAFKEDSLELFFFAEGTRAAGAVRVANLMRPYLEAIVS